MSASQAQIRQTGPAPKPRRKDPAPRHTDGVAMQKDGTPGWLRLKNQPDGTKCVFVYLAGTEGNSVEYYESIGYDIVTYQGPDKLCLAAGRTAKKVGDPITFRGMVLMITDQENADRLEREGPDGVSGQDRADMFERRIHTNGFKKEAFREATVRGRSGNVAIGEDTTRGGEPDAEDPLEN